MTDPLTVEVKLVKILSTRVKKLRNRDIDQCKVQWDQYSENNSTWKDSEEISRMFPDLFNAFTTSFVE